MGGESERVQRFTWPRFIGWFIAGAVLGWIPACTIAGFHVLGGTRWEFAVVLAPVVPGVLASECAVICDRRIRRLMAVLLWGLLVAAWSYTGHMWWQWELFAQQVHNLEIARSYQRQITAHRDAHGRYPESLPRLIEDPWIEGEGHGQDRWGNDLLYSSGGDWFILVSFGRDGKPDGIDYWEQRSRLANDRGRVDICGKPNRDQVLTDLGFAQCCGK